MPCTRTGIPLRSIPAGDGHDGSDAPRRAIALRIAIHCLSGAPRLPSSECSSQSRRQASLPPVLLLIRSAFCSKSDILYYHIY